MVLNRTFIIFGILILGVLLIGNVVATHHFLTEPYPGHNDFLSRWEGARAYWQDGLNPYSDAASLSIQERIYGRAVVEGEDPGFFAYPFYTVFFVGPLVTVSYAWASAIWMVILEVSLIAALFLLMNLLNWKPHPWLLALMLVWTLLFYFSARGLILGQPGHLVYFLQIFALWAFWKGRDDWAGAMLALSTFKPQMGFLLVPLILLWAFRVQRWRMISSFVVVFGVLILGSFILQPSWMGDWLKQVQNYPSYTALGSPVWIVTEYYLGLGSAVTTLVTIVLYGALFWVWYDVLKKRDATRFLWTVALTLTITHLVAVRTATPHYVVFMLPIIFYFRSLQNWRPRQASLWTGGILLLLLILPWIHFLLTVEGEFEHPSVYLPLPFLSLILLWYTRRLWWRASPQFFLVEKTLLTGAAD